MCCREGVEKAPKVPKTSFVTAASLIDSSHLSGHYNNKNQRFVTAKRSTGPSVRNNEQEAEIETVDLASRQTLKTSEKTPPRAFRNLSRPHDKVSKGRTAPIAGKQQPSFDYTNGGQPQISSFNRDASAEESSNKPPSDYDADWMDGLPSPSAILGKPQERSGSSPEHTSTNFGSSWPDSLPSPSALICQNDAATGTHPIDASLEGFDLSHLNDDESDLEAAMVGLSDSVSMQEDVQTATGQMSSHAEALPHCSGHVDKPIATPHHRPTFKAGSSGTSRLFFSTDSPEQRAELRQKRKVGAADHLEDGSQLAPVAKRSRVEAERDHAPTASSSVEEQATAARPLIKPGQPAWVYEFDPVFIAEWQDIVDFV